MSERKPQLTEQQRLAIETRDSSIALSAGAGCGKTFVLTRRFLSELHPQQGRRSLRKLVAITFTERAAREMRDRIRETCRSELRSSSHDDRVYWQQLLRGLDSARISTIHSFCANLLRAHAVDAGLDPQFELLDAPSATAFLRNQVAKSIDELLAGRDADLMELAFQYGINRCRDLLQQLLQNRTDFTNDSTCFESVDNLLRHWREQWRLEYVPLQIRRFVDSKAAQEVLTLIERNSPEDTRLRERFSLVKQCLTQIADHAQPDVLLMDLNQQARVQGAGSKQDDLYETAKDAFKALRSRIKRCRDKIQFDEASLLRSAQLGIAAQRLVRKIDDQYQRTKFDQALLDFDDLLLLTRDLLRDNGSVRRNAAAGIDFLMVDEFQDTDPVQADIVRMLCGDKLLTGKLFLVGDPKQSIYRFRNADPTVFHQLRAEIPDSGRLPLSQNFRSQPAILNFVNCLFAAEMGDQYEPLQSSFKQSSPTPAIEFLFPSTDDDNDNVETRRQREAEWVARRIAQLLQDSQPRIREVDRRTGRTKLRRIEKKDIAVLFRALSNVATYEEAFRNHGIEYYLVGGRAFYAQQEVFDVMNLCRFLDDPDDSISLVGILRSPMFGLSDDSLFALARDTNKTLFDALSQEPPTWLSEEQQIQIRNAARILWELRDKKDRLPLAVFLNLAIDRTGYDAVLLTEFLGRRKLANLRKLVDMARQFDASGLFSLKDFVERLSDSVNQQDDEELSATHAEASDVVRLMTIHQSKGLEFPVVIVADMDRPIRNGQTSARIDRQLGPLLPLPSVRSDEVSNPAMRMYQSRGAQEDADETTRLLYVATTRAADYLILSACLKGNRVPQSPWLGFLATKFGLETGLPVLDPLLGTMGIGEVERDNIPEIKVHHKAPVIQRRLGWANAPRIALTEFRDAIARAEPAETPPLFGTISPDCSNQIQFSVSQIETVDAELHRFGAEKIRSSSQESRQFSGHDAELVGTLLHSVLEQIELTETGSVESALSAASRNERQHVSESIRDHVASLVEKFQSTETWREMMTSRTCHRELDFLLRRAGTDETQPAIISGIIDCLYQTQDGRWKLIDYKTGRWDPKRSPQEILAEYEIQLGLYAEAVQQFLGELPSSIELIFLADEVHRISFPLSASKLNSLLDRVDAAISHIRSNTTAEVEA